MLDYVDDHKNGLGHIVKWDEQGKSFAVFDSSAFVSEVMPL